MKKISILLAILGVFILCCCFRSVSTTASLVENGDNIYLFGAATGKDGTSIICRFNCTSIPAQQTKKELCNSPIYIAESELAKFQNLAPFLDYIKSPRVVVRNLEPNVQNRVNSVFASVESNNVSDSNIGDPNEVCSSALEVDTGSLVTEETSDSGTTTSTGGGLPEIQSLNQIADGNPTLVMYANTQICVPCLEEYNTLMSIREKFSDKINIYYVAVEKNTFQGNILPCGAGGIPQNQIFDKDKKQISCEIGFGNNTQRYLRQLGIPLQ